MIAQNRIMKSRSNYLAAASYISLEKTTDLAPIKGRKVLVLLDEQNLSIGARTLGYDLLYRPLAKLIIDEANTAQLHVFTAADHHELSTTKQRFESLGYIAHIKTIRRKCRPDSGEVCDSNIDNLFAFWAGLYARTRIWDVIVMGSGDYGLPGELSEAIRSQRKNKAVQLMTLSLPESTSQDLNAVNNPNITANLEIGLDLLKPLANPNRSLAASVNIFQKYRFNRFVNRVF